VSKGTDDHIPESRRSALVLVPRNSGRDIVVRALRRESFRVDVGRDPYDAMSRFLKAPVKLFMLSLEGLHASDASLVRELKRLSPDLRVLLLVPEGRRKHAIPYLEAGGDMLLIEPFYSTELRLVVRSLLHHAGADALTGLPNKAAYEKAGPRELSRARREGRTLGVALFDIDHFRRANRILGLRMADHVLRAVADRLRQSFRLPDFVARWGGEEFIVLLTGLPADPKEARLKACEALRRAHAEFQSPVRLPVGRGTYAVTVSGGLGLVNPADSKDLETVFDEANRNLRKAKRGGRNRVEPCCSALGVACAPEGKA
jgi:diguanylate cyclase (GGDEF)-like protein